MPRTYARPIKTYTCIRPYLFKSPTTNIITKSSFSKAKVITVPTALETYSCNKTLHNKYAHANIE